MNPDKNGFYGEFGGAFIPEMLYPNVEELRENYVNIMESDTFIVEFNNLLKDYVGRPSPLYKSEYLSENDFPIISGAGIDNDEAVSDTTRVNISGKMPLEEVEKATILKTLQAAGGNKSEAARRLGITRKTLHKKLKAYGVMK